MYTGANIIRNGLVLALDAASRNSYPGSGTTWTDLSGNNNTGTLTNGPTFNSDNGGSIVFDGTNDFCQFGNLTTLNDMTVQMTVKVLSNSGNYRGFIGAVGASGNDYNSGFNIDMQADATLNFSKCSFEGGILTISGGFNFMTSNVPFGTWANICFSISSTYIQFYLNGNPQLGTNRLNNTTSTIGMNSLVVGCRPFSKPSTSINSNISNVQIYNRALTATEIQQNYNAIKSRFNL